MRGWRWQSALWTGLSSGVALFVIIPNTFLVRFVFAGIGLFAGGIFQLYFYQSRVKDRTGKLLREQLGSEGPFSFEIELTESSVLTKQNETEIKWDWTGFTEIQMTTDSVDFYRRDGGIIVVRRRAFTSESEMAEFWRMAGKYFDKARSTSQGYESEDDKF